MKKHFICATAGHIDHGKTTLIKALTGMDTDTSSEEKERGLSINLGFAYMDIGDDMRVGFIDVPGHQRFIRNMIAGITGIDAVMLVIDANESVMPQTVEHVEILMLMGMKNFIIALTKTEGMDPEYLLLAEEDIKSKFKGTVLENSPIIEVDSVSGKGLDLLKEELLKISDNISSRRFDRPARMYIDRSFIVKGVGTVVTGTLLSGIIKKDDQLKIYPGDILTRARGLQVHEEERCEVLSGNRTAVNLSGVTQEQTSRGHMISEDMNIKPTFIADVLLRVLPDSKKAVDMRDRVRVHFGTVEAFARIFPLDSETIEQGKEGFCQVRFEQPVYIMKDDIMIIRNFSPLFTIGGAKVIDPYAKKKAHLKEGELDSLYLKLEGTDEDAVLDALDSSETPVLVLSEISAKTGLNQSDLQKILSGLKDKDAVVSIQGAYMSYTMYLQVREEIMSELARYHKKESLKSGIAKEELRRKVPGLNKKQFDELLDLMVEDGLISILEDTVADVNFKVVYDSQEKKIKDYIVDSLRKDYYSPRDVKELNLDAKGKKVLDSLVGKELIYLSGLYMDKGAFDKAKNFVIDTIRENGEIKLTELRDYTGSSRKYCLMILERLDQDKITERNGDVRILAKGEIK